MLENYLIQTCNIIAVIRNEYSDYVLGTRTAEACRFRFISTMRRETHNEVSDSDAMIWLAPSSSVVLGSIIEFENVFYQVERINKARRLGEDTVQFIKCDLKVTDVAIS